MRPIKFKGKSVLTIEELEIYDIPHENGWVTGNLIKNGDSPVISSDIYELIEESIYPKWWVVVEVESVGQYTGLKDKNGRDIYEGDIIKKNISKFTKLDPRPEVFYGEVKYYEASFWIDNAKIEHAEPLFDEIDPIQVIGNIYENKHLLEVQT